MLQATIENRATVTGLASVKTAETRSPKLLKVFGHSGLNIESESQMHLTRCVLHRDCKYSQGECAM